MLLKDVDYLKCIKCGSGLKATSFDKGSKECNSGKLSCVKCRTEWPIINGIPRILPDDLMMSLIYPQHSEFFKKHNIKLVKKTGPSNKLKEDTAGTFGFEWLKYPTILEQFESDWHRYFSPFIKKEDLKGKVVADFGCGMAKHGYFSAKYNSKKYIGLDLSEAVEAAHQNTKKFDSLIVQADIYNIPLKGEKIDLFYSIGVLHHLPDPEGGFKSIVKLMKKGSKIFIWVYGKHKNLRARFLYDPIRVVTTRMPKGILYPLCHIPAATLHGINLVQKGLHKIGFEKTVKKMPLSYYMDFPYHFKVSDSYDVFGTPKQVYYEMSEIKDWFKHVGIKKATLEHDIIQGIKGYGVK